MSNAVGRPTTRRPVDGEKIKALMKAKNVTYAKLARFIG